MNLTRKVLKETYDYYDKLSKIQLKDKKPSTIMYRQADLDRLGLTLDDVRDMYFKEKK